DAREDVHHEDETERDRKVDEVSVLMLGGLKPPPCFNQEDRQQQDEASEEEQSAAGPEVQELVVRILRHVVVHTVRDKSGRLAEPHAGYWGLADLLPDGFICPQTPICGRVCAGACRDAVREARKEV